MKVFHVFFFDGDAPFVFGVHQKFHDVQTVRADVFDNIGIFGDFALVDAELFFKHVFNFIKYHFKVLRFGICFILLNLFR